MKTDLLDWVQRAIFCPILGHIPHQVSETANICLACGKRNVQETRSKW